MEDYKIRMVKEYKDLKEKYKRLYKILIKYEAETLDFELNCPVGLLYDQLDKMGKYIRILEIRAEIEKIIL